ncbi:MAG: hypothetical protein JWM98_1876, partial [Thermoleophilia bacterium]|nr:hypothetical protein [Thermoleophilia bacterium]
ATAPAPQAVQGAALAATPQLAAAIAAVVTALQALTAALAVQAQGQAPSTTGGGGSAPTGVGACGMPGCTMDHGVTQAMQGAAGAPDAAPVADAAAGASEMSKTTAAARKPAADPKPAAAAGTVDPSSVKDLDKGNGLTPVAKRGLEEAHKFGLPLVSGKREGNGHSDHDTGNATDVGTLKIGVPESNGATPQMQAFADHMRAEGKAGRLGVTYVISDGRIASAKSDWEWRPYIEPSQTADSIAKLKNSNRGEYNRLQHFDHVHVSYA